MTATPNEGKPLVRDVAGAAFERIPIKTHVVMAGEDIVEVVTRYAADVIRPGDTLFVTEKIVAITQGRSYPVDSIDARPLAHRLSRYVTKTSHGIGLGMPETMEMALRECGTPRILFAAAVAAVTKALGRKGDFYRIAGPKARGIDGPTHNTIPPYNTQVVLVPLRPREVARELQAALGGAIEVAIVDINDFGGNVLGSTLSSAAEKQLVGILADNPLGQNHQSTPLGVVRPAA
ncbi:coenzyme F420-0:L-glutamate ligase [Microcella sp.]|uniref:coenzyme F420-0:L-glutamate ligase n=1 Tax=Microcella sp. TaxID=1913979 RepID=UPI00299F7539|nr:coenzyme F420-0:L-glutamate ligase [Microcella sp.]MDX2026322.1 coenzyme F420-0:L-glutamate ligase [Microcella sp.]